MQTNFILSAANTIYRFANNTSSNDFVTQNQILQNLVPNVWVFIAHVLATIVVLSIIIFLIWRPTRNMIQRRRELMDQKMNDTEANKKLSEKYLKEIATEKLMTQKMANQIISDCQREADQIAKDSQNAAINESKQIYAKALADAERIKESAQVSLKENVSDLAFEIASKIISANVDTEANKRIVDEYLAQLK